MIPCVYCGGEHEARLCPRRALVYRGFRAPDGGGAPLYFDLEHLDSAKWEARPFDEKPDDR
jgi:hypothetical protein